MPQKTLKQIMSGYSLDDLARSLFVLNLWLPNIASPIKLEFLYSCLESIAGRLQSVNRILTYKDFADFCMITLRLIPSFTMLEDYVPEADWGLIKYYLNSRFYKIFYGASLSNQYDWCSAFEVIHRGLEDEYKGLTGRSPTQELEFCLQLQDYIIDGLGQTGPAQVDIRPGHVEIPPEEFWTRSNQFMTAFIDRDHFDKKLLDSYSLTVRSNMDVSWPVTDLFAERVLQGQNCFYYFLKSRDSYYPVLPRRFFSILYDIWGRILRDYYSDIVLLNEFSDRIPMVELAKFMRERIESSSFFGFVSPVDANSVPTNFIFAGAVHAGDKLILIHLIPLSRSFVKLENYLDSLVSEYDEAEALLRDGSPKLALLLEREGVEFKPSKTTSPLMPVFITVVAYSSTGPAQYSVPEDLRGVVMALDQFLGIIDEITEAGELGRFLDYLDDIRKTVASSPINSYLDVLGSFRDSHSVLVPGASSPNFIMLDPNWGSNYRFESLSSFWSKFPVAHFLGHPRGWAMPKDAPPNVLKARSFRGYVHHESVGHAVFFIHCPLHLMRREDVELTDLILQAIRDGIDLYKSEISRLSFAKQESHYRVMCTPASVVRASDKLQHLQHLLPHDDALWCLDVANTRSGDYGIRIVFDDKKLTESLLDATDRSIQVDLLLAILSALGTIWDDPELPELSRTLSLERSKACRFRLFTRSREASFSDDIHAIEPEAGDFKLADKDIALLASRLQIQPGDFDGDQAKARLNQLIGGVVEEINHRVTEFSFAQSIPVIVERADALVHRYETDESIIRQSQGQEVEYEQDVKLSSDKQEFMHDHQAFRYLVEKFVQLNPNGSKILTLADLRLLLALTERLLNLYFASDAVHYGVFLARLKIDHDFIARISYDNAIDAMEREYGSEQSQIDLGMIGNKNDVPSLRIPIENYLLQLDLAFTQDHGFSVRNLVNLLQVLSLWADHTGSKERGFYSATAEDIAKVAAKNILNFDPAITKDILGFLTLRTDEVLMLSDSKLPANDIPVWEHSKRLTRYSVKPVLRTGQLYSWGPYSANRAARIWTAIASRHKLPLPLRAPATKAFLQEAHRNLELSLQNLLEAIMRRHASFVRPNVYLNRLDNSIPDIGDCDILSYAPEQGLVFSIESKVIDPAFCMKDAQRIQRKLFGYISTTGGPEDGYLQKVERRHQYLVTNAAKTIDGLGWGSTDRSLKVVSIFVTQMSFWWTRFPTVTTEVQFVEPRLLDDFVRNALNQVE